MGKSRKSYYAVRVGRNTGIFHSWYFKEECERQVKQFPGAKFKGFSTESEASSFIQEGPSNNGYSTRTPPCGGKSGSQWYDRCGEGPTSSVATSNYSYESYSGQHKPKLKQQARQTYSGNFTARCHSRLECSSAYGSKCPAQFGLMQPSISSSAPIPYTESVSGGASIPHTGPVPVVYTDGCCYRNGSNMAKAGVGVFWAHGSSHNVSEVLKGKQTNIRAELTAAMRAIQTAIDQGYSAVEIKTDSTYTIQVATNWHKKWLRNDWKTSEGNEVQNKDDIVKLLDLGKRVKVKWTHVRGHTGVPGNEAADALAKAGANK